MGVVPQSRSRRFAWTIAFVLVASGIGLMGARALWQSRSRVTLTGDIYCSVEYDVRFTPVESAGTCLVLMPQSRDGVNISRESLTSRALVAEIRRQEGSARRTLVARTSAGQRQARLRLQFDVRVVRGAMPPALASGREWQRVFEDPLWTVPDHPELLRAVGPVLYGDALTSHDLVSVANVASERIRLSITPRLPNSSESEEESSFLDVLDLTRLSPTLADTIALVLLLPFGGLLIAASKRFLGVRSFGYFTAALLAVSFVGVPWQAGLSIFGVIAVIGVTGRLAIEWLGMSKVPRLSLLLLLIVFSLTLTVSVLEYFDVRPSSRGVLLPMICLTIMFERFHLDIDRKGFRAGLERLAGTLAITGVCLLLFRMQSLRALVVTQPEVQFFVAAGLVLVGRVSPEGGDGTGSTQESEPKQD